MAGEVAQIEGLEFKPHYWKKVDACLGWYHMFVIPVL
jgi:hypothetical protein